MDPQTRAIATQRTFDKFNKQTFQWGKNDCAQMCAFLLVQFGYDDPLAKAKPYKSPLGAVRAIKTLGFDKLEDALSGALGLEEIPVAAALKGDIIGIPSDHDSMMALGIVLGPEKLFAFGVPQPGGAVHDKAYAGIGPRSVASRAWRVVPKVQLWEPLSEPPKTITPHIMGLAHDARKRGSKLPNWNAIHGQGVTVVADPRAKGPSDPWGTI